MEIIISANENIISLIHKTDVPEKEDLSMEELYEIIRNLSEEGIENEYRL